MYLLAVLCCLFAAVCFSHKNRSKDRMFSTKFYDACSLAICLRKAQTTVSKIFRMDLRQVRFTASASCAAFIWQPQTILVPLVAKHSASAAFMSFVW